MDIQLAPLRAHSPNMPGLLDDPFADPPVAARNLPRVPHVSVEEVVDEEAGGLLRTPHQDDGMEDVLSH